MPVIERERTARVPHRCGRCRARIVPGDRYIDYRIPPGWDINTSKSWWHGAAHLNLGICYPRQATT